jgi:hypothetical protein
LGNTVRFGGVRKYVNPVIPDKSGKDSNFVETSVIKLVSEGGKLGNVKRPAGVFNSTNLVNPDKFGKESSFGEC